MGTCVQWLPLWTAQSWSHPFQTLHSLYPNLSNNFHFIQHKDPSCSKGLGSPSQPASCSKYLFPPNPFSPPTLLSRSPFDSTGEARRTPASRHPPWPLSQLNALLPGFTGLPCALPESLCSNVTLSTKPTTAHLKEHSTLHFLLPCSIFFQTNDHLP